MQLHAFESATGYDQWLDILGKFIHYETDKGVDPKTGKIAWEIKNGAPLWGGVLSTAGNLVFTGTPAGVAALKPGDAVSARAADLPELTFKVTERTS